MRAELQGEIRRLRSRGITPGLAAVLVGDNAASTTYVRMKGKACDEAGLYHETIRLKPETTEAELLEDRKSTRLNSSHGYISYAVFCLKKKKTKQPQSAQTSSLMST